MTPCRILPIIVGFFGILPCGFAQGSQADDLKQLRAKADAGNASAQVILGSAYARGKGVPRDYNEAAKWYRKAAEQGDAKAQFALGVMYEIGEGVPWSYGDAAKWFRKAADAGNADAQFNLGMWYEHGFTQAAVTQDYAEALKWYRKAADQGFASAQSSLADMYRDGEGVPQNYSEAAKWFRRAAEQGSDFAQFNLGFMYDIGQGVPQNYEQAANWYRKAAEQGYAAAQYNLGALYAKGQGTPQDYTRAYIWLNLAASKATGDEQRKYSNARDAIARKMTPEQIAEAQAAARRTEPPQTNIGAMNARKSVPMMQEGGVYKVPVFINDTITLNFVVDSGAADVTIPSDVVTTLMRTGTITKSDFIGTQAYALADGSTTSSPTFRIRSLKVGDIVLQNVVGSVANVKGDLLLGQSFLGRVKGWSIDNEIHALVLE